jgi:hypothetical protein
MAALAGETDTLTHQIPILEPGQTLAIIFATSNLNLMQVSLKNRLRQR